MPNNVIIAPWVHPVSFSCQEATRLFTPRFWQIFEIRSFRGLPTKHYEGYRTWHLVVQIYVSCIVFHHYIIMTCVWFVLMSIRVVRGDVLPIVLVPWGWRDILAIVHWTSIFRPRTVYYSQCVNAVAGGVACYGVCQITIGVSHFPHCTSTTMIFRSYCLSLLYCLYSTRTHASFRDVSCRMFIDHYHGYGGGAIYALFHCWNFILIYMSRVMVTLACFFLYVGTYMFRGCRRAVHPMAYTVRTMMSFSNYF